MGKDPAVLFYTSDFLSGTAFFTMEQKGEYITLLCEQHQLNSIPEDHLINICGSLNSPVAKKFIKDDDGSWYNVRMKEESEKRKKFCESRRKSVQKRYVRSTNVVHTNLRMENENENENKDKNRNENKKPLWKQNTEEGYQEYLKISEPEFDKLYDDWNWISRMKDFYPSVNIRMTLNKMWEQFWGTKAGWKNKKSKKTVEMNWKSTIEKNFDKSRVFIPRGEVDPEIQHMEMIKRRSVNEEN